MPDEATHETTQQPIAPVQLKVKPKTLALITGGGLIAGVLIVVGAIMPAEFNTDLLGIGKFSGISRLWAPEEKTWTPGAGMDPSYASATPMQRAIVEIHLGAADWPEAAVEYKFAMKTGQGLVYRWQAFNEDGSPATVPVEFDFHGHTLAEDGKEMTVANYLKDRALEKTGILMAPFEGIHGWYFRNHSPDPIRVRVEARGFFELVEPGRPGNEFRVQATEFGPAPP